MAEFDGATIWRGVSLDRAAAIAGDHVARSNQILGLLRGQDGGMSSAGGMECARVPRVLVQYWDSLQNVPEDVARCVASWDALRLRGFDHIVFDDFSGRDFIRDNLGGKHLQAFDICPHPAMRADYFRLCYLVELGGFYADADEVYLGTSVERLVTDGRLKAQPLCYDREDRAMVPWQEAIRRSAPDGRLVFYFNNNPLVSPPQHPILVHALERATRQLLACEPRDLRDIQSIAGPGNLSASLVTLLLAQQPDIGIDFVLIDDWERIASTEWDLDYRRDQRNWRRWSRVGVGGSLDRI